MCLDCVKKKSQMPTVKPLVQAEFRMHAQTAILFEKRFWHKTHLCICFMRLHCVYKVSDTNSKKKLWYQINSPYMHYLSTQCPL